MRRLLIPFGTVLLGVSLLGFRPAPSGVPDEATVAAEAGLPADTLRYDLTGGDALVVRLPGSDAAAFRTLHAPALSWIVGRTFAWRTLGGQEGRETIVIERRDGGRTDTLVLVVDVR